MAKRKRKPNDPAYAVSSARMLAKWSDPEYRESVKARMREKWKDDSYRAMVYASKGIATPDKLREATAIKFEMAASTLRLDSDRLQKQAALLDYQASIIRSGAEIPKEGIANPVVRKAIAQMKPKDVGAWERELGITSVDPKEMDTVTGGINGIYTKI